MTTGAPTRLDAALEAAGVDVQQRATAQGDGVRGAAVRHLAGIRIQEERAAS